ncbi:STAS domain-containing protein [Cryptosporangium japonicum]|uniref:STAS domain-containing protein n=1 Tax=Cryptosporangium japonicum TaxID=80872 RepID=A0ABN0TG23_9ACTN
MSPVSVPEVPRTVECVLHGDPLHVRLLDHLDGGRHSHLEAALDILTVVPPADVVVDVSAVRFFGASEVQFLLRLSRLVEGTGHTTAVTGAKPETRRLLVLTGLGRLLPGPDGPAGDQTPMR